MLVKLVVRTLFHSSAINTYWVFRLPTLDMVGQALAYSAGIELAYTLFTPGPDEALDPVMMGLAAAILLGVSQIEKLTVPGGVSAMLYCIALAGLFAIRKWLIER